MEADATYTPVDRIRLYFPTTRAFGKAALSVLTFDELIEFRKDFDRYFEEGTWEYHRTFAHVNKFLIDIYPEHLTINEVLKCRIEMKEHEKIARDIKNGIKPKPKSEIGNIITVKPKKKIIPRKKKKPERILEKDEFFIVISTKRYRVKINLKSVAFLHEFLISIDDIKCDINRKGDPKPLYLGNIDMSPHLAAFNNILSKTSITIYKFNDLLPFFMHILYISFGIRTSDISSFEVTSSDVMGFDRVIKLLLKNKLQFRVYPDIDDVRFFMNFLVIYKNKRYDVYIEKKVKKN